MFSPCLPPEGEKGKKTLGQAVDDAMRAIERETPQLSGVLPKTLPGLQRPTCSRPSPSCSTVYLDKPMRNHTLMQTIARANRVYPGKEAGVIVDYANVFASLERALALYGTAGAARSPVQNKDALVDELRAALTLLDAFCAGVGVSLDAIEKAPSALDRLTRVAAAKDALIAPDERRKGFLGQARFAERIHAALKPHKRASEFALRMATVTTLGEEIRAETAPAKADVGEVLRRIGEVLDRSIEGAAIDAAAPPLDLSRLDMAALAKRFEASPTKHLDLARLQAAIRAQLDRLIAQNPTRASLREKFETLIASYNAGSGQIELLFQALLELSRGLTEEETRHAREQLTEAELTVFDLLTRPGPDLTTEERDEVKKVTRQLLARLRAIFTVDWQKTAQSPARIQDAIEEALDDGLPRAYTPDLFKAKAGAVFQHVYEQYGWAA